jgi:hypothetical protein
MSSVPEPEPDLDELLELFREPDEEPRRKRMPGSVWVILALLLSMTGVWLAVKTATGELAAVTATAGPMKPTKSKDRTAREEPAGEGRVVEDYLARCKKGMTAREVRWIVEDFQRAGLDLGMRSATPEEYSTQRKNQHAWYLDLLKDGLGLSEEQVRTASAELDELLAEALERFGKELEAKASEVIESGGRSFRIIESGPIDRLVSAESWLEDERYAPWELCELTEDQLRLTWFGWVNSRRNADPDSLTYEPEMPWFDDRMLVGGPSGSGGWTIADFPTGDAPTAIRGAGSIFPFTAGQRFRKGDGDGVGALEHQAMGCHPAQLKTLLLVAPTIASRLLESLDRTAE